MPEPDSVQCTRKLGHGLIVDTAPRHASMALVVLVEGSWGARLQHGGLVNIADQVLYRITGYDPATAALLLELVEDWRPKPSVLSFDRMLLDQEAEEIKARWQKEHGNNQTAHHVTELRPADEEKQP